MSEWKNLPETVDDYFGFVYKITRLNAKDGEKYYYIGCKQLTKRIKRKPLKGKIKNRIDHVKSDWEDYWGSSEELKKDIEKHGKDNFKREILHMVKSKWELKYSECVEQFKHNVLLDECSYNGIQNIRIGKIPKSLKESGRYKELPKF